MADFIRLSIWALGISFILTACGKAPVNQAGFEQYVELYRSEAALRGVEVDAEQEIVFGSMEKHHLALCRYEDNKIIVNIETWGNLTEVQREIVMLHEFGHCDRSLDHEDGQIMQSKQLSVKTYLAKRSELLDHLFR